MNGKPDSQKNGLNLELVKKLVLNQLDKTQDKQEDNLHKAVNLADLKAIAQAGLSFSRNDSDNVVHKNLSDTLLSIVGQRFR